MLSAALALAVILFDMAFGFLIFHSGRPKPALSAAVGARRALSRKARCGRGTLADASQQAACVMLWAAAPLLR